MKESLLKLRQTKSEGSPIRPITPPACGGRRDSIVPTAAYSYANLPAISCCERRSLRHDLVLMRPDSFDRARCAIATLKTTQADEINDDLEKRLGNVY
ncbi:hypothetical protein EVAR_28470_1 [Eumeta japonica]|uniref:Uncharacterized protein n=1 Tax=Eumeta variegata TaxID=151549 RepID=A0A4C1VBL8_EUMVA|nr:hypothetical protein EVAR_28470_1 [Eumeta japonica]